MKLHTLFSSRVGGCFLSENGPWCLTAGNNRCCSGSQLYLVGLLTMVQYIELKKGQCLSSLTFSQFVICLSQYGSAVMLDLAEAVLSGDIDGE